MAARKPKYEHVMDDPAVRAAAQRVIDAAPPATPAQIARLRVLFRVDVGPAASRDMAGGARAGSERLEPRRGVVGPADPSDAPNDAHATRQGHLGGTRGAGPESGAELMGAEAVIPVGNTLEVVLDRLKRAGNFASNGCYMAALEGRDPAETADLYIKAAQAMLDEARSALDQVRAASTPRAD